MLLRMLRLATVMAVIGYASAAADAYRKRAVFPGIGEYFFFGIPNNWTNAYLACQASNTHLAVIDSAAEAAALKQMIRDNGATFIHLGFNDHWTEGKYNNIFDKPIIADCTTGTEWAVGSPKGSATYNCGGFSEAGLTDVACSGLQVFICETPTTATVSFILVPDFGYYKHNPTLATWTEAAQNCRDENAHLMIINSQEEVDAVRDVLKVSTSIHVGIHRSYGGNDNWLSVLGPTLNDTGYSIWSTGEPDSTYLTYPYVYNTESGVGLEVEGSDSLFASICELDIL